MTTFGVWNKLSDYFLDFVAILNQFWHAKMNQAVIPHFLQLPTQKLLDEFGGGRHKPGSGSAAALLGLVACKMMQTVILATRRAARYEANFSQLDYVGSILSQQHEPFFRDAVQQDSVQYDRYHQARLARNACTDLVEKRRLADMAREALMPATQIPLEIAKHAVDTAERGLEVELISSVCPVGPALTK